LKFKVIQIHIIGKINMKINEGLFDCDARAVNTSLINVVLTKWIK